MRERLEEDMATETRTVTDEEKILAASIVAETLQNYLWLAEPDFESLRHQLTEELLWTSWGRQALRRLVAG